jgi:LysM repeat protein
MNPTVTPAPITQAPTTTSTIRPTTAVPTTTVPPTTAASINTVSTTLSIPSNLNNCVTYTAVTGDTCWGIASKFGITLNQLILLNLNVNCNNLQVGQITCVQLLSNPTVTPAPTTQAPTPIPTITVPPTTAAPINTVSTTLSIPSNINNCVTYTAVTGDTCLAIASKFGITLNQLISLNLNVNCNNLQVGQIMCVQLLSNPTSTASPITQALTNPSEQSTSAQAVTSSNPGSNLFNCVTYTSLVSDSCWSIAAKFGILLNDLFSLNPTINCNNLQVGQPICIQVAQTTLQTTTTTISVPVMNCVTYTTMPGDTCLCK